MTPTRLAGYRLVGIETNLLYPVDDAGAMIEGQGHPYEAPAAWMPNDPVHLVLDFQGRRQGSNSNTYRWCWIDQDGDWWEMTNGGMDMVQRVCTVTRGRTEGWFRVLRKGRMYGLFPCTSEGKMIE